MDGANTKDARAGSLLRSTPVPKVTYMMAAWLALVWGCGIGRTILGWSLGDLLASPLNDSTQAFRPGVALAELHGSQRQETLPIQGAGLLDS